MARLPGAQDLGGLPGADQARPIATYDAGAIARGGAALSQGGEALAKGVQQFGAGIEKAAAGTFDLATAQSHWEFAKAHAEFLTKKTELDTQTATDTNYGPDGDGNTLPQRYDTALKKIRDDAAATISTGPMRGFFEQRTGLAITKGVASVQTHARSLESDASVAWVRQRGEKLINDGISATDDDSRREIIDAHNGLIDGLVAKGFMSATAAVAEKQNWAHQFATADLLARADRDPDGVINTLRLKPGSPAEITNRILQVEGGGKNARSSATGGGQFIDQTWLDIVKAKRPELAQGKSDDEILALRLDKNLTRQMTEANRADNEAYLRKQGLEPTPGAQYLAHFLGPAGAAAVLKGDPNKPVADVLAKVVGKDKAAAMVEANPSILGGQLTGSVKQWADAKMGGQAPGGGSLHEQLRPDVREQILHRAMEARHSRNADELTSFKARLQDTTTEAMNVGTVAKPMAQGEFISALGAEAGPHAFKQYQAQLQLGKDIAKVASLDPDEQQKLLDGYAPKPGAAGYADQVKRQDVLQKAIERDRSMRAKDPEFKKLIENSIAEAGRAGEATNPVSKEEFIRRFGKEDGERNFASYSASLRLGRDVAHVSELSGDEQRDLLKGYEPTEGSADYVEASKRQDALAKAIEKEQQLRSKDPEFKRLIENTLDEAGREGGAKNPVPREEFIRRFGTEDGSKAYAGYRAQLQLGRDVSNVDKLSPQEQTAMLGGYDPDLQRLMSGADYSEANKRRDILQKAIGQISMERGKDPAAFAIRRLPVVQEAYAKFHEVTADPLAPLEVKQAAAREFATKMDMEQARIGVPAEMRTLLPKEYIDQFNAKLSKPAAAGGSINVAGMIENEAKIWGDAWPQVYKQMSKGAAPVAMVIGSGVKPAAAQILTEFANTKLGDIANDQSEERLKTIQKDVRDTFRPLSRSMTGSEGTQQTIDGFQAAGEKLAAYYVRQGKTSSDAAKQAFDDLLGHKYDFSAETYRVPTSIPFKPAQIALGVIAAKNKMAELDLAPAGDTIGGLTPEYLKRETARAYARDGQWVTAPDESGLALVYKDRAVRRADGKPLVLSWEQLARMGKDAHPEAPAYSFGG